MYPLIGQAVPIFVRYVVSPPLLLARLLRLYAHDGPRHLRLAAGGQVEPRLDLAGARVLVYARCALPS